MRDILIEELERILQLINKNDIDKKYLTEDTTLPPLKFEAPPISLYGERTSGNSGDALDKLYKIPSSKDSLGDSDYNVWAAKNPELAKKKPEGVQNFKFGDIAEIPYATGAKFFYLDNIDTGEIVGLKLKDEYGYYEEIETMYGTKTEKIRRYYPKNDWEDWTYLKKNKIPYGFKSKEGDYFHLVLKLVDPSMSVANLDDPTNKSRGWALSQPQTTLAQSTRDAGSGYYKTVGDQQVGYNFVKQIIPGDEGSWDLDTRSAFDQFMDSWVGTLVNIVVAVAIGVITEQWQISAMIARGAIMGTNAIRARLVLTAALAEGLVEVPTAIYYFQRPGYEQSGWLSLAMCMLPFIQGYGPLKNIFSEFSQKTCLEVAEKIMAKQLQCKTKTELITFVQTLTLEQRSLFMRFVQKADLVSSAIEAEAEYWKKLMKQAKKNNDPNFMKYYDEMSAILEAPSRNFFVEMLKDVAFGFTYSYFFMGIIRKYSEKYQKQKEKEQKKIQETLDETKITENLTKVSDEIKQLPSWITFYAKSIKEPDLTKVEFAFTDSMVKDMVEKGLLTEETKKQLYLSATDKAIIMLEEKNKYVDDKSKLLSFEEKEALMKFMFDPMYKETISQERRDYLQQLMDKHIEIYDNLMSAEKTTETDKTSTEISTTENPWIEEKDILKVLEWQKNSGDTIEIKSEEQPDGSIKYFYRQKQVTTEPEVKINTDYDKSFDYKLENGKYFYKGKGTLATKYPDWVEATGNALNNIKTNVKF